MNMDIESERRRRGFISLAQRLRVPNNTQALLWDMDGVIIDSLGLDLVVCNYLLKKYLGARVLLSRDYIRSIFAYDVPKFWELIFEKVGQDFEVSPASADRALIVKEYTAVRKNYPFKILPGIRQILSAVQEKGLQNAVVSNNPIKEIEEMLAKAGIVDQFNLIIGNDAKPEMPKKPAPDIYLFAAEQLKINPKQSVVIEDSLLGAESGKRAGCFTIAVATGGDTKEQLQAASFQIDKVYDNFANIFNE